jgi:hypothetical protein
MSSDAEQKVSKGKSLEPTTTTPAVQTNSTPYNLRERSPKKPQKSEIRKRLEAGRPSNKLKQSCEQRLATLPEDRLLLDAAACANATPNSLQSSTPEVRRDAALEDQEDVLARAMRAEIARMNGFPIEGATWNQRLPPIDD